LPSRTPTDSDKGVREKGGRSGKSRKPGTIREQAETVGGFGRVCGRMVLADLEACARRRVRTGTKASAARHRHARFLACGGDLRATRARGWGEEAEEGERGWERSMFRELLGTERGVWLVVLSESVPLTSNQELGVGRDSSGREAATLFSRSELRLAGSSGMVPARVNHFVFR